MNFQELLIELCNTLNCSQNDLTDDSSLSAPVVSRYLSGERTPSVNSEQLYSLAKRLSDIAVEKGFDGEEYSYDSILSMFTDTLQRKEQQYNALLSRFVSIINLFDIKIKDLAKGIHFETSFLYRIRAGERRPANPEAFYNLVASYIADHFHTATDLQRAADFLQCDAALLSDRKKYIKQIQIYFDKAKELPDINLDVSSFLVKMDEFNLDEYIQAIHFNDIKTPTSPITLPISRYYYGIEEMRKAELDFFKATVLSKSTEDVFMYADMPMNDMAKDMDFNKKWMFGIAATLKKGLHINIIHNLDRPFDEIILGLEAWIPIYMTGQVSPYHLKGYKNEVFHQLNYCSGSAALFGECIEANHNDGRYYLSNSKHDIAYYRKKTNAMLKHAKPLMDIYNCSAAAKYMKFIMKSMNEMKADRHIIAASLPLYTMPEQLLYSMIASTSSDTQKSIMDFFHTYKEAIDIILRDNRITYDYHILSQEEFHMQSQYFSIPELFISSMREYSYEEYLCHVQATLDFASYNDNFIFNGTYESVFKNIQITIVHDKYFIVSKYKSPSIHFVIRHDKMLRGIEHFHTIKQG